MTEIIQTLKNVWKCIKENKTDTRETPTENITITPEQIKQGKKSGSIAGDPMISFGEKL